ncbi:hypothetical protein QFC20_002239 [Naganishia adeliensis]|uniref:Uncharacterized protein n=1 Tax=Naganishia adeliensis TaxID=92952 RepID=A0ACC2WNQ6_9TREE|nr:hypothetical protein QFC20_002239 [Naganishia adeliensis]
MTLASALDWTPVLGLVFGGCCSNVFALEAVLKSHPNGGIFLTFIQFLYVTLETLSTQFTFFPPEGKSKQGGRYWLPRLKPRVVPLRRWIVQVALFLAVSLMNNWAFGLKVPVPIHIIFRSGGLCVSMFMGWKVGGKRYSRLQVLSVILITFGITLATLSAPPKPGTKPSPTSAPRPAESGFTAGLSDGAQYALGIAVLAVALVVSSFMGLWQEGTYKRYGAVWQEGLFYSHALSLPFFLPFLSSLTQDFTHLSQSAPTRLHLPLPASVLPIKYSSTGGSGTGRGLELVVPSAWIALGLNVFTQALCIKGVNRLTARVSSLTVNLILTLRKAVSLAISVTYYGSGFTPGLAIGSAMVLAGTAMYSLSSAPKPVVKAAEDDVVELSTAEDSTEEKTYNITVKRDDAANNPAEKVQPEEMLARMRLHATEVRRRGTRVEKTE